MAEQTVTPERLASLGAHLSRHWLRYAAGLVVAVYLLTFVRGLGWEWRGILFATRTAPHAIPARAAAPNGPTAPPPGAAPAPGAVAPVAPAAFKQALPPSDETPPQNATDEHGVYYDAQRVAVMGIDADPNGVYNVPPGRQVRIGGSAGALYDVQPGGKLTPATKIKEWPE
jgi:hypothetical protein